MAAPAHTTPELLDPTPGADPAALAAFVTRRGGRVLTYLESVAAPGRAVEAAGEAFAAFRRARALEPAAEAEATSLLRATRRAAALHAENPYRPQGRERPARRIGACDAMPRMLVAWTESRLSEPDVARLVAHLQDCPDCRALRDAFDRAELGYRAGRSSTLDAPATAAIAAAMARALPAPPPEAVAPAAPVRRTALPASRPPAAPVTEQRGASLGGAAASARNGTAPAPIPRAPAPPAGPASSADGDAASGDGRVTSRTASDDGRPVPAGRRTAIPAPPPRGPDALAVPAGRRTSPTGPPQGRRTAIPERPVHPAVVLPVAAAAPSASSSRPTPEDPLGPEALGYAVPHPGLPRAARRGVAPRARRRRRRPSTAAALPGTPSVAQDAAEDAGAAPDPTAVAERSAAVPGTPSGSTAPEPAEAPLPSPGPATTPAPGRSIVPASISVGGMATVGRRALDVPLVRQLGVPAVLLLAVLIAALIAAGAFAGRQQDSVAPVPRPTIPTVPATPNDIPPLP